MNEGKPWPTDLQQELEAVRAASPAPVLPPNVPLPAKTRHPAWKLLLWVVLVVLFLAIWQLLQPSPS
jgi:hypothetical protein